MSYYSTGGKKKRNYSKAVASRIKKEKVVRTNYEQKGRENGCNE